MNSTLTVIIPTLNNTFGLKYLLNYFKDKPYQLIVVDNKPTSKKLESLKVGKFESLIYLPQKKNQGFAGAVNLGAKYAKTKWLLILNDDIEFEDDQSINRLYMEAEKRKVEALSPTLKNPNGEVENYGYRVLPHGKVELVKKLESFKVKKLDGLTAACLLIKANVFRKLKGFDESFFAYLEDVEFFLRFKKAGYKMGITTDIEFLHNHMTTTKTMGSFKAKQDMINWGRLYFKHKEMFKFDLKFIIERLRNLSGYLKTVFNKDSLCNLLK